jgi:hypothetical protein
MRGDRAEAVMRSNGTRPAEISSLTVALVIVFSLIATAFILASGAHMHKVYGACVETGGTARACNEATYDACWVIGFCGRYTVRLI